MSARLFAYQQAVPVEVVEDVPQLQAVVRQMHAELDRQCREAGATPTSPAVLEARVAPLLWQDTRPWWRSLLDRLLRRRWTPPAAPMLLRVEVLAEQP